MVEVKRKKNETFESLFRRFTRHLIRSSKIFDSKSKRFFTREPNKNARRDSKLVRLKMSVKNEYLKRIGRLEERDTKRRGY